MVTPVPPSGSPPLLYQTEPSGRILRATNGFPLTRYGINNTVFCDHPQRSYYEPGRRSWHGPFPSVTESKHESQPACVSSLIAAKGPGLCMSEFDCSCWSQPIHIKVLPQRLVLALAYKTTTPAMGPSPCVSGFYGSFGSQPEHIRLQPLLWVPAHAYQGSIAALGPGPVHITQQPLLWVPAHAYQGSIAALGPGPCISHYNPCYGSRLIHTRIQPPLWVPAHAYQNTNSALGLGP